MRNKYCKIQGVIISFSFLFLLSCGSDKREVFNEPKDVIPKLLEYYHAGDTIALNNLFISLQDTTDSFTDTKTNEKIDLWKKGQLHDFFFSSQIKGLKKNQFFKSGALEELKKIEENQFIYSETGDYHKASIRHFYTHASPARLIYYIAAINNVKVPTPDNYGISSERDKGFIYKVWIESKDGKTDNIKLKLIKLNKSGWKIFDLEYTRS